MKEVRVGMLGLGSIAQVVHVPILGQLAGVTLAVVGDADEVKARTIGGRIGSRVVHTDEEVYGADDVDAIVICTPNYLHEEQAIAALEAGKHVLVEKPLALTPEAAERVIAAARASGRTLMVAMNNRYRPDTRALKPFADGGELGDIFLTRGAWLNQKMRTGRPTWRHRLATAGGGALMDLGVQTLDLCLWTLGFPQAASVFAHTHVPPGAEVEDTAAILLRMQDGSCISLTVSWSLVAERDRHYMRLLGTRGSAMIQPLSVYKEGDNGLLDVTPTIPPQGRENAYTASYRAELAHFIACVRGEASVEPPHEQIELMRLVVAAYRSAAEKREVAL
jgi:predicted dehydrogenase